MINLLPQNEKRIFQKEEKIKIISILGTIGFIFFLCLVLILSSIRIYVSGQAKIEKIVFEQAKKEFRSSDIKDFPDKIKSANKTFADLNSFYKNQFKLTKTLENISKM